MHHYKNRAPDSRAISFNFLFFLFLLFLHFSFILFIYCFFKEQITMWIYPLLGRAEFRQKTLAPVATASSLSVQGFVHKPRVWGSDGREANTDNRVATLPGCEWSLLFRGGGVCVLSRVRSHKCGLLAIPRIDQLKVTEPTTSQDKALEAEMRLFLSC